MGQECVIKKRETSFYLGPYQNCNGRILMTKRDEYVEKMKTQLDEWNTKLASLETRASQVKDEAKVKYEEEMALIVSKRDEAKGKLSELQGAGEEAWEELKAGMDQAWSSLRDAFEKAKGKFQ
jgi:uncharacterized coiled-coil DUF342 family protein